MLNDLKSKPTLPIDLHTDNSACHDLVHNEGVTGRTRHFDRWLMHVREMRKRGIIKFILITTSTMVADIFTKALDKTTFLNLRGKLLDNG